MGSAERVVGILARAVFAVAVAAFGLIDTAKPALAHTDLLTRGFTSLVGGAVRVVGTVRCTVGENVAIFVSVDQEQRHGALLVQGGTLETPLTCNALPVGYDVTITANSGRFKRGPAAIRVDATTSDGHQANLIDRDVTLERVR